MGWERHGIRSYYYRSRRVNGKVVKTYCGPGVVGRVAAIADARRRDDCQAQNAAWKIEQAKVNNAVALSRRFATVTKLLAEATLLAAGLHRVNRKRWRKRKNAHTDQTAS